MDIETPLCPCPVCGDEYPMEEIEKHCTTCLAENDYSKKKTTPVSPPKPKERMQRLLLLS